MTTNIRTNRQTAAPRRRFGMMALILTCTVMVTGGFFVAAQQHFASMDYGMKNSRLRKQVDQLEAEKRRLMLAREISLSPTEIKKAVKKIGLGDASREPMAPTTASLASLRPAAPASAPARALVEKTVSVKPTRGSTPSTARMAKSETFNKKGTEAE